MSEYEHLLPPVTGDLVMMLAFVDGKPYVAPAGSSLQNQDLWIRVESIEGIADKFRVRLDK